MKYLFEIKKDNRIIVCENVIEAHKVAKELSKEHYCKVRFMPIFEENAVSITPPENGNGKVINKDR